MVSEGQQKNDARADMPTAVTGTWDACVVGVTSWKMPRLEAEESTIVGAATVGAAIVGAAIVGVAVVGAVVVCASITRNAKRRETTLKIESMVNIRSSMEMTD